MSRTVMTADAISEAIRKELIDDESLHGIAREIPSFSVQPLPRGVEPSGANWKAEPYHSLSPKMEAATREAIRKIQARVDLQTPFYGASASPAF